MLVFGKVELFLGRPFHINARRCYAVRGEKHFKSRDFWMKFDRGPKLSRSWTQSLVSALMTQKARSPAALAFRAAQVILGTRAFFSRINCCRTCSIRPRKGRARLAVADREHKSQDPITSKNPAQIS